MDIFLTDFDSNDIKRDWISFSHITANLWATIYINDCRTTLHEWAFLLCDIDIDFQSFLSFQTLHEGLGTQWPCNSNGSASLASTQLTTILQMLQSWSWAHLERISTQEISSVQDFKFNLIQALIPWPISYVSMSTFVSLTLCHMSLHYYLQIKFKKIANSTKFSYLICIFTTRALFWINLNIFTHVINNPSQMKPISCCQCCILALKTTPHPYTHILCSALMLLAHTPPLCTPYMIQPGLWLLHWASLPKWMPYSYVKSPSLTHSKFKLPCQLSPTIPPEHPFRAGWASALCVHHPASPSCSAVSFSGLHANDLHVHNMPLFRTGWYTMVEEYVCLENIVHPRV